LLLFFEAIFAFVMEVARNPGDSLSLQSQYKTPGGSAPFISFLQNFRALEAFETSNTSTLPIVWINCPCIGQPERIYLSTCFLNSEWLPSSSF
jgi:hypothetical protein